MMQPGEKRFTFRLYEDNPVDVELDTMLERLLADGKFRSKNEVLRKGIRLTYEASYPAVAHNKVPPFGFAEPQIIEISRRVADEVVSRMGGAQLRCVNSDYSIPDGAERLSDEMVSFLSNLNNG